MFQIYPGFPGAFAADVSPDVASFTADSRVPWGVEALSGAITQPAWRTKPSWYLVTTEDKMIPPDAQKEKSDHIFQVSSVRGLRITGYCGARCENHANGWTHRLGRKYAISRGQVGRGRFQRRSGDGGRAVRGEGLCAGAGRHSDQLGAARRAECAGSASGLCGLGRFDAQAAAKSRRTFGRRSAEDRGRNSATGEPR